MNAGIHETSVDEAAQFPSLLANWLTQHAPLIAAGTLLRRAETAEAEVESLLELRALRTLRLAWEVWLDLDPGGSERLNSRLEAVLPIEVVDECRLALWGTEPPDDRSGIHLVR